MAEELIVDGQISLTRRIKARPKVLLIGGPDVDARLELMHCLKGDFNISALGSLPTLHDKFSAEGFDYSAYRFSRGVNPLSDLFTVGQLFFIFRRLRPQVVHTFDIIPSVWARLAARLAGVPVIIGTLQGLGSLYSIVSLKTRLIRFVYQPLQKLACRLSDLTIFQNHDTARHYIAAGVVTEQKAMVIPGSGVSTDLFAPSVVSDQEQAELRAELGFQSAEIVVTMVSRLIRSKGVLEFMAAAQEVGARFPYVRFLLVGHHDAESIDRLNSSELAQLKQALTWPGSRRDIPAVLAVSDIFVLPSYGEGIPRVLLEAASMGLPIVTTDSPGCNQVVEHGANGFLVPVRDSETLTQAIVCLIEQPELRLRFGQFSRQRVVERFDLTIVAEQTRSVYRQLLTRKALLPATDS